MTESIIKLREQLVELSKDPIETRKLLDQLTEEEIDQANIESPFHVGKNDIEATKDGEIYKLNKTRDGYVLQYHGGYAIKVDDKLVSTANALDLVMNGISKDEAEQLSDEEKEGVELTRAAVEMVMRMPMFIFSHPGTTLNVAAMGVQYMLLLQKIGEVPTEETENPEYDKFLVQMNEMMENFAAGLEKEGREYEERMGYGKQKEESQGENQGESKTK